MKAENKIAMIALLVMIFISIDLKSRKIPNLRPAGIPERLEDTCYLENTEASDSIIQ